MRGIPLRLRFDPVQAGDAAARRLPVELRLAYHHELRVDPSVVASRVAVGYSSGLARVLEMNDATPLFVREEAERF